MRTTWTFHSAGKLVFGLGAVAQLGELAGEMTLRRLFVVTDRVLVNAGVFDAVRDPLAGAGIALELFDGGEPEPSLEVAERAAAQARAFRPDGVLGLGGGSNMDLAKVVALVLAHGGTARDYLGDGRVPGPVLPLICVPTTSGTGSEVTAAAVLTDTAKQMKLGILSNHLRPKIAVIDPRLTVSCPLKVTADSGIDALTHAIEAYTAIDNTKFPLPAAERSVYQGRHPLGDCLAEKAIAMVGEHLVTAVREPSNLAAREGMSLAATVAGLAFSNVGVALVHAMEYPVGGATHCSHGAGNGLLLPFVMRFNLPGREREMVRIAELLGERVEGCSTAEAAERAIAAVERLKREIGIPERLRDLGVRRDQLAGFAEKAFGIKRILRVNPRPVTCQDIESVFAAAL
ncbi:MAG TPA: iron-containing alcohol dehydrogenase [Pirellulales bacterium]|jgi:alcohol dehydrogenase class IV|nr:iron-containing alcohol dehydrogenase [Pirellulales bacterium]